MNAIKGVVAVLLLGSAFYLCPTDHEFSTLTIRTSIIVVIGFLTLFYGAIAMFIWGCISQYPRTDNSGEPGK